MSLSSTARRWLRSAVKPAAMALVAGGVAVSLIVTTPSNAQALVPVPVLPAVFGSTAMAIPELMATSSILGPVGWGIAGVTVLGIGLYATKDYWLPYVTGAFGQPKTSVEGSGQYANLLPGLTLDGPLIYTPGSATTKAKVATTMRYKRTTGAANPTYVVATVVQCKRATDGSLYNSTFNSSGGITDGASVTISMPCGVNNDSIVAAAFGAACSFNFPNYAPCTSQSTLPGPTNVIRYGTAIDGGFDPRSSGTKYRVEAECIDASGVKSTITAFSAGNEGGIKFPSCEAAGKGHGTGKVTVWATPPGTQTEENIWSATAPTPTADKPLCAPTRAQPGCKLAVKIDGKECAMGVSECINWSDLNKDPNWTPRISCQYGPYSVATALCNPLEQAYEPGGAPATDANTDGNPDSRSDVLPDGSTQPRPSTDPNAPPATGTVPGGAGSPAPSAPGDPAAQAECWPNGWAMFNPLEWVLKPIGCAFIPKQDISRLNQDVVDKTGTKAPVAWLTQPMIPPSGGGCPNWVVNVGSFHQNVVCESSYIAALRAVRGPLFLLVATAMVWPLLRSLWYAAIPILRVTPSGGK